MAKFCTATNCLNVFAHPLVYSFAALIVMPLLARAAPQVAFLYPAGGQVGQTVSVAAQGSFSHWPPQVWTDRQDVAFQCAKEKGKLLVKIAANAAPGVALLRLYDAEGAAAVRPFLIGALPEVVEQETNDERGTAHVLSGSVVANGQLSKRGDVDVFRLSLAKGQTLVAAMDANRLLGSPMDGVLQILSPEGFVLAQNDDQRGIDPLLVFTAPKAGNYLVRTFAFPATANSSINFAGENDYVYRLTLTTEGFLDAALPMALHAGQSSPITLLGWNLPADLKSLPITPSADASFHVLSHPGVTGWLRLPVRGEPLYVGRAMSTPIELPAVLSGQLSQPREQHEFSFHGQKGAKMFFRSESRSLGYAIDPVLAVLDKSGKPLATNDDAGRDNREAELGFTAPDQGEYRLVVRDLHHQGGPRFVYRITAGVPQADFALTFGEDAFSVAAGKSQEISVKIDRRAGFKEEIEITATGLPEGVTAEPVKSAGSGGSAKSVKLKLTAAADAKPASGTIRVVGRSPGEKPQTKTATAALAGLGDSIEDVWLTVTPGK